jgi:TrmH family RNA methyltransferase
MIRQISSQQNPHIKDLLLLQEKPRERRVRDLTVVEGIREVRQALAAGHTALAFFFCKDIISEPDLSMLISQAGAGCELNELSREVFGKVAYREDSGGIIALVRPNRMSLEQLDPGPSPLLLVLETVEKPGNLGAILRTADAAGLTGVIVCDPQTDVFNPNVIRSSLGCIFTLPVVTSATEEVIEWLRAKKIRSFATALTAENYYHNSDFRQPSAIVMGSEASGLSDKWLHEADELIKIPMMGKVDSMNVSASAAIVVFEALRQRGF